MIDDTYLLGLLSDLVNIPSTFPHEKEALLFLEEHLQSLGFEPRRFELTPDRWNILVRMGSGSPVVCLNAHSDTVPPNGNSTPQARRDAEKIYGLGSCDTKASIAAMIACLKELRDNPPCTVDLMVSVDEEGDGLGVRSAIEQGYNCDYAIVGEPTSLNVVRAHSGLIFFELTTAGVSTHGSAPWNGVNAIQEMTALVDEMRAQVESPPSHPLIGKPSLNLGAISAGDRPNRVPESCKALIDIRIPPPSTTAQALSLLDPALKNCVDKGGSWKITKRFDGLSTPEDSPLVKAVQAAAGKMNGHGTEVVGLRGWTEAESFRTELGVDAVVFGPGHLIQAHSGDEFVEIEQVTMAAQSYADAIRLLAKR